MERVSLIDIDSKIPNLALMKLSNYYKKQGSEVQLTECLLYRRKKIYPEIEFMDSPDRCYVSCIYDKNQEKAKELSEKYRGSLGGPGYYGGFLPDEIEFMKPDYDLYPSTFSQGFTTRGCKRSCSFCVVPKNEGKLKRWQHVSEFHDDRFDTVMLMDNNILVDKDWFFENTNYLIENNLKLLEHGLDCRLVDEEIAEQLSKIKFAKTMHFAFDQLSDERFVRNTIDLLDSAGINVRQKVQFYVLCGYNTTFEEDIYRCELLKDLGTCAYVMPYERTPEISKLARWANRKWIYFSCSAEDYLENN